MSKRMLVALASGLLVATSTLYATLQWNATRTGVFDLLTPGATVNVPLTNALATSLAFYGSGRFAVTYSAECHTSGGSLEGISLEIKVDGVALPPTAGTHDAFCTGIDGLGNGWATHSITVLSPYLKNALHKVTIDAVLVDMDAGSAPTGQLNNSSLIVTQ